VSSIHVSHQIVLSILRHLALQRADDTGLPGMFLIDTVDTSGDDVSRYVRKSVSVLVISVTPIDLGFASRWQVQTLEA